MSDQQKNRISLPTNVELDVWIAGDPANPPIIFLHGFPESHRTWRHQVADLSRDYYCIAPDQRGYVGSSKPSEISDYAAEKIVADLFALADHLGLNSFSLVGHDWGGAIVWMAALQKPQRVDRLIAMNGPHPLIFQRSLFDNLAQREASQYMRAMRAGLVEQQMAEHGMEWFFDNSFNKHLSPDHLGPEIREKYLADWAHPGAMQAMIRWYHASTLIVPPMPDSGEEMPERPAFLDAPFPILKIPTLIVWGKHDQALLPCQLEGLDDLIENLTIKRIDAGHFLTWEAPDQVNAALREWLD